MTLDTPIETLLRLRQDIRAGLRRLGIVSAADLLYHFPVRYADASSFVSIAGLADGMDATVRGTIKKLQTKKSFRTKIAMSEATIEDVGGQMRVIWFNQPYLAKMLSVGQTV